MKNNNATTTKTTSVRVSSTVQTELNRLALELSLELNQKMSSNDAIAYLLGLKNSARG